MALEHDVHYPKWLFDDLDPFAHWTDGGATLLAVGDDLWIAVSQINGDGVWVPLGWAMVNLAELSNAIDQGEPTHYLTRKWLRDSWNSPWNGPVQAASTDDTWPCTIVRWNTHIQQYVKVTQLDDLKTVNVSASVDPFNWPPAQLLLKFDAPPNRNYVMIGWNTAGDLGEHDELLFQVWDEPAEELNQHVAGVSVRVRAGPA